MGCNCGGSRRAALQRQQDAHESGESARREALAAAESNPGQGMYWQPPPRRKQQES